MKEELMNNQVTIEGEIASEFYYDHEVYGEKFYEVYVSTPRLDGSRYDTIPCVMSERIIDVTQNLVGVPIVVHGQYRSFNEKTENGSRLLLRVFVLEFEYLPELVNHRNMNNISLNGYVCKPPVYRITPLGREVAELMLAVNRPYHKADYIPCICWGRGARFATELLVGDFVHVDGRIQSREYKKRLADGDFETRVAYEVSVGIIEQG